jgi:hypothetical protein
MRDVPSIDEMVAHVTTADQGRELVTQIERILEALPPEPDSDTDHRLRSRLEAFTAGLRLGLRLAAS